MIEQEIKCYESIARKIHNDGSQLIMDGNPCSSSVSLLFYVEDILRSQEIESAVVSALCDDLDTSNRQLIEMLREMGDDCHGY